MNSEDTVLYSMDTAPKDGREIILKVKMRAGVAGKYLIGHHMGGGHCIEDHPPIEKGWYFWNGNMFDRAAEPIGWMPIPGEEQDFPITSFHGIRPTIAYNNNTKEWNCTRPDRPEITGTGVCRKEAYLSWKRRSLIND